jgi:sialic acid synthase SpsE
MIQLGNRKIAKTGLQKPYLIAEIGVNFYDIAESEKIDPFDAATLMIDEAKKAGCDAVKFQAYKAHRIASKYAKPIWDTSIIEERSQIKLYEQYDKFDLEDYEELKQHANKKNVQFLATLFDEKFVDDLDLDIYKIASLDLTNYPLIKKIAKNNKPILLSTGASQTEEIYRAIRWIKEEGNNKIIPLHCVLSYPTDSKDANLGYIKFLDETLKYPVGYSCHVVPKPGMPHLITAWLLGAKVIEKHFTLDKTLPGNDHYHAFNVEDGIKFNEQVEEIITLYGKDDSREIIESEKKARVNGRRCLFLKKDVKKDEKISLEKITAKRSAGVGIDASLIEMILGKRASNNLGKNEPLHFKDIII